MSNQKEKDAIHQTLKNICAHKLFSNAPTHIKLLGYLVEKAVANEDVKEVTIGIEFFGRDYDSAKNGGTVRSYLSKLRKKLNTYNTQEKLGDPIAFHMELGQYNLKFLSKKELQTKQGNRNLWSIAVAPKHVFITFFSLLLVGVSTLLGITYFNRPQYIWEPFFNKDSKNIVVISDQYMVTETNQFSERHASVYSINSHEDYLKYIKKHPNRKLETTDYTLMSKMAPFGVKELTGWFYSNDSDYTLELESQLTFDKVRANNLIFIGQSKSMNLSSSLFLKDSNVFSLYKDGFLYEGSKEEIVYDTKHSKIGSVEYAMVSFTSLSEGKSALYFVSNNDIGTISTLRKFMNKDWLEHFLEQIPKHSHFNALFEVKGLQRNDISCRLMKLEVIE